MSCDPTSPSAYLGAIANALEVDEFQSLIAFNRPICPASDLASVAKLVRKLADKFGMPAAFTLDACRHGGMTELEEAELTTGQGKVLSGHRTDRAYGGYAKTTMKRALAATRKRHAHRLANVERTKIQNEGQKAVQNANATDDQAIA